MAEIPEHEEQRLAALRSYDILDTEAEPAFDDLTRIVARLCGVPMATVSLIDHDRQWFKARLGLDLAQTPRDQAFCAHCILQDGVMEVPDALADPRFAANPHPRGLGLRFYVGAPLSMKRGGAIGSLCLLDTAPGHMSGCDLKLLQAMAQDLMEAIAQRKPHADMEAADTDALDQARPSATVGQVLPDS